MSAVAPATAMLAGLQIKKNLNEKYNLNFVQILYYSQIKSLSIGSLSVEVEQQSEQHVQKMAAPQQMKNLSRKTASPKKTAMKKTGSKKMSRKHLLPRSLSAREQGWMVPPTWSTS